jgi:hypothetical protein
VNHSGIAPAAHPYATLAPLRAHLGPTGGPASPVRWWTGGSRIRVQTVAEQVAYSASNGLLLLGSARQLTPAAFGRFAFFVTLLQLALAIIRRGVLAEAFTGDDPDDPPPPELLIGAVAMSLAIGAFVGIAATPSTGGLDSALIGLALVVAGAAEGARFSLIATRRFGGLIAGEVVWVVLTPLVLTASSTSPYLSFLLFSLVGLVVLAPQISWRIVGAAALRRYWERRRATVWAVTAEVGLDRGSTAVGDLICLAVVGAGQYAAVAVARLVFTPATVILTGLQVVALREGVTSGHALRWRVRLAALCGVPAVLTAVGIVALGRERLLDVVGSPGREVWGALAILTASVALSGASIPYRATIRMRRHLRLMLGSQGVAAALYLLVLVAVLLLLGPERTGEAAIIAVSCSLLATSVVGIGSGVVSARRSAREATP